MVLIDSEKESENEEIDPERKCFQALCQKFGFKFHATDLRAIENYLTQDAIEQTYPGRGYRALGPYESFEEKNNWAKENSWLIAKNMTPEDFVKTDLCAFLKKLEDE
ncbi:MAG: hypothetical protein IPH01_10730 [Elusimicrobia bacterium]|nr:hypothetical protein [Elusimicrobiota bacterium]